MLMPQSPGFSLIILRGIMCRLTRCVCVRVCATVAPSRVSACMCVCACVSALACKRVHVSTGGGPLRCRV